MTSDRPGFYTNPVYPHSFPDPFVLKFNGEYFAYCTGDSPEGNVFGVLRSRDLIEWEKIGGAMRRLDNESPFYWAPEVTYSNGTFYLYYSVGNEELMEIRLATSKVPFGGFEDAGIRLTSEDFAIDPHVFKDGDGKRYLFYATDFLEHTHIGTGVVADRMISWHELAGSPVPVVRAKYDWQVYDPRREEKGGVRWHTVEGPFVLERKGKKYLMFSGGNWKQPSYGVGFAVTEEIERAEEWEQFCDGVAVAPVLRSVEQKLVGPGHNSVVRGPDNRQFYCVYHFWQAEERVLAVNRMGFAGDRMLVEDEPYRPKRLPKTPLEEFVLSSENWRSSAEWEFTGNAARNSETEYAEIVSHELPGSFLCEFSLKSDVPDGRIGFALRGGVSRVSLLLVLNGASATIRWECEEEIIKEPLDADFDLTAIHLVRVEVNHRTISVDVFDANVSFRGSLRQGPRQLALIKDDCNASFSGLQMTEGFEDLFGWPTEELSARGWNVDGGPAAVRVVEAHLSFCSPDDNEAILLKGEALAASESLIDLKLAESLKNSSRFGFVVVDEHGNYLQRLVFSGGDRNVHLDDGTTSHVMPLPDDFDTWDFHKYGFYKKGSVIEFEIDTRAFHDWDTGAGKVSIGIFAAACELAIDAVSVTSLGHLQGNGS